MTEEHPAWRRLGLDFVTLRIVVAAAEEGGLARAATRENIALSAASRRISDFEARAGVQIFDRHDRGVALTPAGEALIAQLNDLFQLLDRIASDLEATRGGLRGHVRLYAHMSATSGLLPARLAEFFNLHPEISVTIDEHTTVEVLHAVRTGIADVGLVSGTVEPEGLVSIPWESDELVAVLPADHLLCSRSTVTLADLIEDPFIGLQKDSALLALYRDQARVLGRELRERAHVASFESVRRMVAEGLGVAILPAATAAPFQKELGIVVRPVAETWAKRSLMLCARDFGRLPAAARRLVDHLTVRGR